MKNIIIFNIVTIGALFICSCEIDNYQAPNLTLKGVVVDVITGEPIQTRQPDGIRVRLLQDGYENPTPLDFWVKPDGTFQNTRLFAGTYEVSIIDGPFEESSVEPIIVDLNSNKTIQFEVAPFARISDVDISGSGGTITANYKISGTSGTRDMLKSVLFCHTGNIVHEQTRGLISSSANDLSTLTENEISSTIFMDEISGLETGKTYYVRVGVLSDNPLNRYNYSPIMKINL